MKKRYSEAQIVPILGEVAGGQRSWGLPSLTAIIGTPHWDESRPILI